MKRVLAILLATVFLLSGCSILDVCPSVSLEDIASVYSEAGYSVWTDVYDEPLEDGQIASIQADHPDGDYIYFSFFSTNEDARACKAEYYHPVAMLLFSAIYGDPSWVRWVVYDNVIIQYDEPNFFVPFIELILGL